MAYARANGTDRLIVLLNFAAEMAIPRPPLATVASGLSPFCEHLGSRSRSADVSNSLQ